LETRDQFSDADSLSNELDLQGLAVRPIAFAAALTQELDDVLALEAAVGSGLSYVPFVANKKKFAARAEFLRERGLGDEGIARIKAPAGLDLGAVTQDETAASILAELIHVHRSSLRRKGLKPHKPSPPLKK
jgi:xanthine/CO dehydrogenase XdhC/CoxF family maturation factor